MADPIKEPERAARDGGGGGRILRDGAAAARSLWLPKSLLARNSDDSVTRVVANLVGRLSGALVAVIVTPIYVRLLGAEAFGIVGLFAVFDVVFNLLDLGLAKTASREMAIRQSSSSDGETNGISRADVLKTFELIYWTVGIVVSAMIFGVSSWMSREWLQLRSLPQNTAAVAISVIAIVFLFRWPVALYSGALDGLRLQVRRNGIGTAVLVGRTAMTMAALLLVAPDIRVFLSCYVLSAVAEVFTYRRVAWSALAGEGRGSFSRQVLRETWRYALTFNVVGAFLVLASQADKFVISKMLPLENLAYYSIALTASGALPLFATAVGNAMFPNFSALFASSDLPRLRETYDRVVAMSACVGAGGAVPLLLFSYEILLHWTQSLVIATRAEHALSFLAAGSFLWCLQFPSYQLLAATGRTRVMIWAQSLNVLIAWPSLYVAVPLYGIAAGAAIWVLQTGVLLLVYPRAAATAILGSRRGRMIMPLSFLFFAALIFGSARILTGRGAGLYNVAIALIGAGFLYSIVAVGLFWWARKGK